MQVGDLVSYTTDAGSHHIGLIVDLDQEVVSAEPEARILWDDGTLMWELTYTLLEGARIKPLPKVINESR